MMGVRIVPISRREKALAALANRMQAARGTWESIPEDEPYTLLTDGDEQVTQREYGEEVITLSVEIRRAVRIAPDDATVNRSTLANQVLAELRAEVIGTDPTLDGACEALRYAVGSVDIPADSTDLIGATVSYELDYRCSYGSPY